jgi:hypothetical protein
MEDVDWTKLSEATKAEMELGKKQLQENQEKLTAALKSRAEEENPELKVPEKEPVFPVAGRKVKANPGG